MQSRTCEHYAAISRMLCEDENMRKKQSEMDETLSALLAHQRRVLKPDSDRNRKVFEKF